MKILILGGTGILSTDFTRLVGANGDEVFLLNRGTRIKKIKDISASLIEGDLRKESKDVLRSKICVRHYDVVVDFLSYNVQQMKKTLQIIENYCDQYIFISSATVYKNSEKVIKENSPTGNEDWDYAYQKYLCEQFLAQVWKDRYYTIVRPYVTYGDTRIPFPIIPDGYHYSLIARILAEKPVVLFDDGKAICTLTHTKDFADVLYRLLLNPCAKNEIFHITSPEEQTWKDVYLCLCKILNKSPNCISISASEVKKHMPEFYPILMGDKGRDMRFDSSKVQKAIGGYRFITSLSDGLEESIRYFMENPQLEGVDYKWDGKIDYFIKKKTKNSYHILKVDKARKKMCTPSYMYYVMTYPLLRKCFDLLRSVKRRVGKE